MNNKKGMRNLILVVCIPIILMIVIASVYGNNTTKTYDYSDIIGYFKSEQVEEYSLDYGTGQLVLKLNDKDNTTINYVVANVITFYQKIDPMVEKYNADHTDAPMVEKHIRAREVSWLSTLAPMLIAIVGMAVIYYFFFRKLSAGMGEPGKQMNFGKARVKKMSDEKRKTTFADVAGADEEKEELSEIVEFLKNPQKYNELGARIPKGVLLVGPPGTGKTLLARAVAGEAGVPFFSISGSDFVEMFVGVGASRVRDLFEQAKKNSPCIIFIDEIDAVGRQRGAGLGGGHDEREQTLNQLLVEMDGFGANEGVIMIAATNRPDILDPALMRPGRFDRQVTVGYPDIKGREAILHVHARGKPLAPDVDLKTIAGSTAGFTGADLENLLNEAALLSARKGLKAITMLEIEEATIKVMMGTEKKSHIMSDKEKKLTAYHEGGHAVATYYCPTQDPVHQISIIPRGMAGGYTMSVPTEDRSYKTKKEMKEDLVVLLGGRVAEAITLDDISTGASNDIERATKLARAMITKYGMTEALGPITYGQDQGEPFLGRDMGHIRDYSEATASAIDKEIRSIMNDAYTRTHEILEQHLDQLHDVAAFLFKHEKMSGEEFRLVMEGKMQGLPTDDTNVLPPDGETPQRPEQQSEKSSEETSKADSESENAQENSSDQKPDSPQNPSAE